MLPVLFCFPYLLSPVTDWAVQNSTEVFFLSGYRGTRRLKKVLNNIRMFSREQSNLARSVQVLPQSFHTCQGQVFNFLVFNVFLFLTSSSYTSAFTITSCYIITSFSQKILQQGMGKHPVSLLWGFSPSLPALQRQFTLVPCRGWEQWSSALCFPKWYQRWRRMMVTDVAEQYSSYAVFQ